MMSKDIYFLFVTPVLISYGKEYGINYLRERGWRVFIWDLSPIIYPIAYQTVTTDLMDYSDIRVIHSQREYRKYLKTTSDNAFFILTMDFVYSTYFVHRLFKRKQHYGYMNRINTNVEVSVPSTKRLENMLFHLSIKRIINSIFIRIPKNLLPVKKSSFVFLGGKANTEEYLSLCLISQSTKIKYIHSNDYENYLVANMKEEKLISEKYCVFLDQYLPYHPDILESDCSFDPDKYYQELEDFFDFLEKQLEIKVVIAAHPRSNYGKHTDRFKRYLNIKNATCDLVKNAEFVLAQFSTSISYAVLFYKPIILMESMDLIKVDVYRLLIKKYSDLLDSPILNISKKSYTKKDIKNMLMVKGDKYEKFIVNYIKADYGKPYMNNEFVGKQLESMILNID